MFGQLFLNIINNQEKNMITKILMLYDTCFPTIKAIQNSHLIFQNFLEDFHFVVLEMPQSGLQHYSTNYNKIKQNSALFNEIRQNSTLIDTI